jgi:hypothetical protein
VPKAAGKGLRIPLVWETLDSLVEAVSSAMNAMNEDIVDTEYLADWDFKHEATQYGDAWVYVVTLDELNEVRVSVVKDTKGNWKLDIRNWYEVEE